MSVSHYYLTKPDGYVRFEQSGKSMEGEFYRYESFGQDSDPTWGYIRPFNRVIRQQLIDNLQAQHGIDLQTFTSQGELITCDASVTHKDLQARHQVVLDAFEFIDQSELTTEQELIAHCRVDLLRRQYIVGRQLNEPKETLDNLNAEFLKWVTPFYTPLRYERKWLTRHREGLFRLAIVVTAAVLAYFHFS